MCIHLHLDKYTCIVCTYIYIYMHVCMYVHVYMYIIAINDDEPMYI